MRLLPRRKRAWARVVTLTNGHFYRLTDAEDYNYSADAFSTDGIHQFNLPHGGRLVVSSTQVVAVSHEVVHRWTWR